MNIGIAVHRFDRSEGTGRYAVELVERLARDARLTVYAARLAADVPPGVEVVRVPAITTTAYAAVLTFPPALRAVRRPHDVFHAQGWVTHRADVVTAHIVLAAWRRAARQAGVRSPPGERVLGGFVEARERRLMRRAGLVIAPSKMAARHVAEWYGRSDGVRVVRHGFPAPAAPPDRDRARAALGLPADRIVALFVGDIRKGLDAALAAVAAVEGVVLAVASHTPPARIRARAAAAGVGDRAIGLGPLADTAHAYAAADLLLQPTIYDTFGLAIAEAMAHGVPAIVTPQAGITELIAHGRSGWIVDGPRALADALRALARDPSLRIRIGEGARAVAASRTWDAVAAETVAVYREVLA